MELWLVTYRKIVTVTICDTSFRKVGSETFIHLRCSTRTNRPTWYLPNPPFSQTTVPLWAPHNTQESSCGHRVTHKNLHDTQNEQCPQTAAHCKNNLYANHTTNESPIKQIIQRINNQWTQTSCCSRVINTWQYCTPTGPLGFRERKANWQNSGSQVA